MKILLCITILLSVSLNAHSSSRDLFTAVDQRDTTRARESVASGADINIVGTTKSGYKITPLLRAIALVDIDMVRLLISLGADVNLHKKYAKPDKYQPDVTNYPVEPALSAAISKATSGYLDDEVHLQIVSLLLKSGAKSEYEIFDLSSAVRANKKMMVKLLLSNAKFIQLVKQTSSNFNMLSSARPDMAVILRSAGFVGETEYEEHDRRRAAGWIENDGYICGAVRSNSIRNFIKNLEKYYNTTIEESYFKIKCDGKDPLGMVVDNPADRYVFGRSLESYFKRKIGKPEIFTQILQREINSRDILARIEYKLDYINGNATLECNPPLKSE